MQYRENKKDHTMLSTLGFGCMRFTLLSMHRHLVQYPLAFWASRRWAWAWR